MNIQIKILSFSEVQIAPLQNVNLKNIRFWCEEISVSTSVIDMIEHDYKIHHAQQCLILK